MKHMFSCNRVPASANRFFTGGSFKDAAGSGKDINYVYAQLQATY
jgi:hypothetical protein